MNQARFTLADGSVYFRELTLCEQAGGMSLTLERKQIPADAETVDFLLDIAQAVEGEEGYFLLGNRLIRFVGHEDGCDDSWSGSLMHFFGVKKAETCHVVIVDGLWEQHKLLVERKEGVYCVYPRFMIEGVPAELDLSVKLVALTGKDADYSGMARAYRAHQLSVGACRKLRDRMNEHLAYAADAPEVRIRLAWKPVPTPVEEQTIENEPPMHVAIDFAGVEELMEKCHQAGVDKAQFCLVGWNVRGHDGRWPQAFPVEEALGGEEGLKKLIRKAEKLGYRIVCHTNATDCYHIADCWTDDLPMRRRDGSMAKNAQWSGGRMYDLCPEAGGEEMSLRTIRAVRELGFRGIHYIDVISTVPPRRCFSEAHPCSQREFISSMRRIARYAAEEIGGFQSEGGYDFMANELDMALYVDFNMLERRNLFCDENVPVWQMVYHDMIFSNPGTATINYPAKDWQSRLKFIEYGGRPAMYVYSKFRADNHWMGSEDFVCDTPEGMERTVRGILQMQKEYRAMGDLRLQAMVRHDRQGELAISAYESGARVVCNYGEHDVVVEGTVVPAHDFAILGKTR